MQPKHAKIREHRIGSSDAAKILGLSPYGNAHDVYLRLTDRLETADIETPAMKLGKMLESPLIDEVAAELVQEGVVTGNPRKNVIRVNGNLCAQLDAAYPGEPVSIEAKTDGNIEGWGDNRTDAINDKYAPQIVHQAAVADVELVAVPVFFVGKYRDYRSYRVRVSQDAKDKYIEFMERWFEKHIKGDTPPDCAPTLEVAKLIKREPGKVIPANESMLYLWAKRRKIDEAKKRIKQLEDRTDAMLLALMDDAQGIEHDGKRLEMRSYIRKAYSVAESSYKKMVEVKA